MALSGFDIPSLLMEGGVDAETVCVAGDFEFIGSVSAGVDVTFLSPRNGFIARWLRNWIASG